MSPKPWEANFSHLGNIEISKYHEMGPKKSDSTWHVRLKEQHADHELWDRRENNGASRAALRTAALHSLE